MNVWIFQANPKRYDILNALLNSSGEVDRWLVNQHWDKIKTGDVVLMWMSGVKGGIYAVGEITSNPLIADDVNALDKYWINEQDRNKRALIVNLRITAKLVNNPILRAELKGMPGLQNLSILRFSQGTNFPVSNDEWIIIANKIDEHLKNDK